MASPLVTARPFCALCLRETSNLSPQPLGRFDAMVLVCLKCNEEPARHVRGPERPYEAGNGSPAGTPVHLGRRGYRGDS